MQYILASLGIAFISTAVWARLGGIKWVYLFKSVPGILPSGFIYATIPVGIWLFSIYIASFEPQSL